VLRQCSRSSGVVTMPEFGDTSAEWKVEVSMVSISVLGGLFFAAYCISVIRTKRALKPGVQTLFNKK
jgi:hypothetical protein